MWIILVSLVVGVIIGIVKILPERYMKYNSKFQQGGIILLLFAMGASIGADRELIYNLKSIGTKAFVFAFATSIFSIAAVYFTGKRFLKEEESK